MSSDHPNKEAEFAERISEETPWWAKAPIWLAAGIVGVPSLIAIMAGYFIAHSVTTALNELVVHDQSQNQMLTKLHEDHDDLHREFQLIQEFMRATLKTTQQSCLHSATTPEQRAECIQVPD